jgi:hypothetical protein
VTGLNVNKPKHSSFVDWQNQAMLVELSLSRLSGCCGTSAESPMMHLDYWKQLISQTRMHDYAFQRRLILVIQEPGTC